MTNEEPKKQRRTRRNRLAETEQKRSLLWGTLAGIKVALAEANSFPKTIEMIDDVLGKTQP